MKKTLLKKITLLSSLILTAIIISSPFLTLAADAKCEKGTDGKIVYCPLEDGIFDDFSNGVSTDGGQLGTFLGQAFQFGLAVAAALAVVMIVWGGVEIMLSESVFKKEDGKKKIQDAIYGLLLALVSWLILYIINPEILNFKI